MEIVLGLVLGSLLGYVSFQFVLKPMLKGNCKSCPGCPNANSNKCKTKNPSQ